MFRGPLQALLRKNNAAPLPSAAREELLREATQIDQFDPGTDKSTTEAINWLCRAQDNSPTNDGGVSRHFSLLSGWGTSYPETTGYIIPSFISYWQSTGNLEVRERAKTMLDWLVSIQHSEGGFQGGMVNSAPCALVTFNTGQILLGLAAGVCEFGDEYRFAMRSAANWLVHSQDEDGCWRKFPTPFAVPGEKAYETHVSWGLLEATRADGDERYAAAALKNIKWSLTQQEKNGWVRNCCLLNPQKPLTHTLGYFLRGVLEGYRFSGREELLEAALKTGQGLLSAQLPDGRLPGRLKRNWRSAVSWTCLTGDAQIAHCWLILYSLTGDKRFLEAALSALSFVRKTVSLSGPGETRGAVKGSYPIDGDYCTFEYPNWAAKFVIDANMLAREKMKESNIKSGQFKVMSA
jgi:hypothetical protein